MLKCSGCHNFIWNGITAPLCDVCYEAIVGSHAHAIRLTDGLTVTALCSLGDYNYEALKSWKASGGLSWERLIMHKMRPCHLTADVIVPIPQSFSRAWKMKGGSSLRFSHVVSQVTQVPVIPALEYIPSHHEKKALLSLFGRMMSESSFKLSQGMQNQICGKNILIADDFLTTGKTLLDAYHCLIQSGVASVTAVVFAAARVNKAND